MHAIATLSGVPGPHLVSTHAPERSTAHGFQVAFLGEIAEVHGETSTSSGRAALLQVALRPMWHRYQAAFSSEGVPTIVLSSSNELAERRRLTPADHWVIVMDPEAVSVDALEELLAPPRSRRRVASPVRFIALCPQSVSPRKLRLLFEAEARVAEKNVSPDGLLRLCRLAKQGDRPSLVRFSDQARLSGAERRAFFAECAGLSKCEAADELGCSQRTLETYWGRIFAKLGIRSTDGVVAAALRFAMFDVTATEPSIG